MDMRALGYGDSRVQPEWHASTLSRKEVLREGYIGQTDRQLLTGRERLSTSIESGCVSGVRAIGLDYLPAIDSSAATVPSAY